MKEEASMSKKFFLYVCLFLGMLISPLAVTGLYADHNHEGHGGWSWHHDGCGGEHHHHHGGHHHD
jgi:hypothetical protein